MKFSTKLALAGVGIALLATVPWWGSAVLVQFGINALILATLAQSWNIIGGYTGYPSFGNSVFYGLGGYGVAIAMVQYGLPFPVGLAIGIGLAVGRRRGCTLPGSEDSLESLGDDVRRDIVTTRWVALLTSRQCVAEPDQAWHGALLH